MAPRRKAAARESPRRNPSRNASGPPSTSTPSRVTKTGLRSGSTKAPSATRSRTRSRLPIQSSEAESSSAEDFEENEDSPQSSRTALRRSTRGVASTSASNAPKPRASSATVKKNEGIDTVSRKPGRNRGRKPKATNPPVEDDVSSDETGDDESDNDFAVKKSATKSPATKARRGRPPAKKAIVEAPKDENSVIPNWLDPRVEHAIWVQVFRYAAVSGDEEDVLDVNWLLRTARVCRNFADPALTVLYKRPPVKDEAKAQGLVELLEKPLTLTAVNYRAKVEALHIDVRLVSLQGFTSPIKMMQNLPRLSEVLLLHGYDQPPYRLLKDPVKWTYPSELWHAFEVSDAAKSEAGDKTSITRLRSWQWSSRLMDKNWEASLSHMKTVHQMPSFAFLRKIKLVNYQLPSVRQDKDPGADPELLAEDERSVKLIADSLSVLGNLEHLVFESSTILCTSLFSLLPATLKRLELINCAMVTADNFGEFLVENGRQLESLVLHHNRSLDLSFLTLLDAACPHLKELRMNLKYFNLLETVDDNDPFYDHLLLPGQTPNWPESLELVHLENLRQWDMDAAEAFLQSFINRAPALPMLRHLSIKAMLDIPWRQRSDFRKSWQEKLEQVFLRPTTDPQPISMLRGQPPDESTETRSMKRRHKKTPAEPTRRSSRVVPQASGPSSRASSTSRGLRGQKRKPQSYREPDSDEFDSDGDVDMDHSVQTEGDSDRDAGDTAASSATFIQGLCTVVDLNIDNQKPREHQYSMDDFLNDDRDFETDDEWDGDMDFE